VTLTAAAVPAPLELHEGRLHALVNPIELDGRVTWYPAAVRGFAPVNCYLATEGETALMIDTGVSVHRDALVRQLQDCLPGDRLAIAHTRIAEYPAICNTTAIAERVPVEALYAGFPGAFDWLEFRPRGDRPSGGPSWAIGHAPESRVAARDEGLAIGDGGRRLHIFPAAVRLLPSQWFYDDGTRTLFSGDAFSHAWRATSAGPWIADDDAGGIDPDEVLDHLLARCWWLAGAASRGEIRRALEEVFATYEIETIAPGYGCIIHGRREVERHYELLHGAIERLGRGSER
jgi:hypothetical protein